MKMRIKVIFLLLLFSVIVSCDRENFTVDTVVAQPYVTTEGVFGLSIFMVPSVESSKIVSIQLYSPGSDLSWNLTPIEKTYSSVKYVGSSGAVMPLGTVLPKGEWKFVITSKDGRTVEQVFNVSYGSATEAIERNFSAKSPVYDTISNITVIPVQSDNPENITEENNVSIDK